MINESAAVDEQRIVVSVQWTTLHKRKLGRLFEDVAQSIHKGHASGYSRLSK